MARIVGTLTCVMVGLCLIASSVLAQPAPGERQRPRLLGEGAPVQPQPGMRPGGPEQGGPPPAERILEALQLSPEERAKIEPTVREIVRLRNVSQAIGRRALLRELNTPGPGPAGGPGGPGPGSAARPRGPGPGPGGPGGPGGGAGGEQGRPRPERLREAGVPQEGVGELKTLRETAMALAAAIDNPNSTDAQIKSAYEAYNAARRKVHELIRQKQQQLRQAVSPRAEAGLVLAGIL